MGGEDVRLSLNYHQHKDIPSKIDTTISGISKNYQSNSPDPIILACEDILQSNPTDFDSLFLLGQIYYTQKKIRQSKQYIMEALSVDHTNVKLLKFVQKFFPELFPKHMTTELTEDAEHIFSLAHIQLNMGNTKEAELLFIKVNTLNPYHLDSRRLLAELYLSEDRFEDAIRELNVIRSQKPDDPYILYNIGVTCLNAHNIKRALACFKEALLKSKDTAFSEELNQIIRSVESDASSQ